MQDDTCEVSVVMAVHGARAVTERCLASLADALGDRLGRTWQLVVVDNASPDSTPALLRRWADRATILSQPRNLNVAGGWNAGVRAARGHVVAIINNDLEFAPGALDRLVETAREPEVGLVGCRLVYPSGLLQHGGYGFWRPKPATVEPFHLFHHEEPDNPAARATLSLQAVTGAVLVLRRDVLDAVGGIDPAYVNGWEDVDLAFRVRARGLEVVYRGDVDVVHHEGVTSGAGRYGEANRVRFLAWHGARVADDRPWLRRDLGVEIWHDTPVAGVAPDGAAISVEGPLLAATSAGAESRALLHALDAVEPAPAARHLPPPVFGPVLAAPARERLLAALRRPRRADAVVLQVLDGAAPSATFGPWAARMARVPGRRLAGEPDVVLAVSHALAAELVRAGAAAGRLTTVPPPVAPVPLGPGGEGVLVLLPGHDRAAAEAASRAVRAALPAGMRLRAGWTVVPRAGRARLREWLPDAEPVDAAVDERRLHALAGAADVVVHVDPADAYGRLPLVAAAAGALPVTLARPAIEVLDGLAAPPSAVQSDLVRVVAEAARAARDGRMARARRVAASCGGPAWAATVRAALESARSGRGRGRPPRRPARRILLVAEVAPDASRAGDADARRVAALGAHLRQAGWDVDLVVPAAGAAWLGEVLEHGQQGLGAIPALTSGCAAVVVTSARLALGLAPAVRRLAPHARMVLDARSSPASPARPAHVRAAAGLADVVLVDDGSERELGSVRVVGVPPLADVTAPPRTPGADVVAIVVDATLAAAVARVAAVRARVAATGGELMVLAASGGRFGAEPVEAASRAAVVVAPDGASALPATHPAVSAAMLAGRPLVAAAPPAFDAGDWWACASEPAHAGEVVAGLLADPGEALARGLAAHARGRALGAPEAWRRALDEALGRPA